MNDSRNHDDSINRTQYSKSIPRKGVEAEAIKENLMSFTSAKKNVVTADL